VTQFRRGEVVQTSECSGVLAEDLDLDVVLFRLLVLVAVVLLLIENMVLVSALKM
jgi:phage shock protein PspC (stress-responsive transcriptional regulator)